MSFLTRTTPVFRVAARTSFAPRAFSTSFVQKKSPVDTAKDAVKTVDRAVSDKLVDGIEVGRMSPFTQALYLCLYLPMQHHFISPQPIPSTSSSRYNSKEPTLIRYRFTEKAAGKAKEVAGMSTGEAKGKAQEVAGQAKGKAAELKGEAKGKAEEVKGKL